MRSNELSLKRTTAEHPKPNFEGFYLLIAFAIENFLKGLALAKGKVKIREQNDNADRDSSTRLSQPYVDLARVIRRRRIGL
jgi:hypothetical protein